MHMDQGRVFSAAQPPGKTCCDFALNAHAAGTKHAEDKQQARPAGIHARQLNSAGGTGCSARGRTRLTVAA